VPNIADPLVCSSTKSARHMWISVEQIPLGTKKARAAGLKPLFLLSRRRHQSVTYPGFFSFRVRDNIQKDPIFRPHDLPMACQLELARFSILPLRN
jgi:hypothetical protein